MTTRRGTLRIVWAIGILLGSAPVLAQPTGSLTGRVRVTGKAPVRAPLHVVRNREICGNTVVDDRLVIGPSSGVRWAVVTVDGAPAGKKPDGDPSVVLDNLRCRFSPHVLVAEVGQWLEIHNSDPILHNAHATIGKDTLFNLNLAPDDLVRRPLGKAGRIAFTCDMRHTWMSAYVVVAEHPYQSVTDAYGEYQIDDIPPGTYNVQVWHEELGTQAHPVTIEAGGVATIDFAFPVPGTNEEGGS
jgi:hypothetical protein